LREKEYLKKRYAAILSSVGMILLLSALVTLTPILLLLAYPEEVSHALWFIFPAGCLALLGIALSTLFPSASRTTLSIQEGGIIVLISWIVVILFSAWPFFSILGLPFSRALFESVSGWTTTGLSVVDVTKAGPMILFWRSVIQLAGGAGLAIIMMSAIVGPTGVGISSAEGRSDQLLPHVRQSARLVMLIYTCYAAAGTLAYRLAGMSFFDAVNHAFSAVSTGGFSTVGYGNWNGFGVLMLMVLMLIGGGTCSTAGGKCAS
jgi:trk system potassium uptake protein